MKTASDLAAAARPRVTEVRAVVCGQTVGLD